MKKFLLINKFLGYQSKKDKTNIDPRFMVTGSQNVLINDAEKVSARLGYSLFGAANTSLTPIISSYEWKTSTNTELPMRKFDTNLQFYYSAAWRTLKDDFSTTSVINFAEWWSSTESKDLLLFVDGTADIFMWSGGITTYSATATATIVEAGDASDQLSSWVIVGATAAFTDSFVLYWGLADAAGDRTVELYRDSGGAAGDKVATGTRTGDGSITLAAANASGITGSVTVAYSGDDAVAVANTLTLSYVITKEGTNTWAEDRFLTDSTRQVTIGAVTYTYTGGEGTTSLTGVTPDPTAGSHTAGDVVFQTVRTTADTPAATFDNDLIFCLNNYVYFGDLNRRDFYVSSNTDFTDFTFSTPREPTEGAILTLDSNPVGFGVQDDIVYISSSQNDWYQVLFARSADLTKETISIKRIRSGGSQGAVSQQSIGHIKNQIVFFGNDRTISTIGNIENINTPQTKPISDPIKSDLLDYDLTQNPHVRFFQSKIYVTIPSESLLLIYDYEKEFWQPPQRIPLIRLAEIDGDLYGHSNSVPETYLLFDGVNDNGNPIEATAKFAYRNYGDRAWQKNLDEWYTEGYISSNATIVVTHIYDFEGDTATVTSYIDGSDSDILSGTVVDVSLGKNPFGKEPFGTQVSEVPDTAKFRVKHEIKKNDFYEIAVSYECNDLDAQWELLAFGGNARLSSVEDTTIKQ